VEGKTKLLFLSPFFYPEPISTAKYNTYLVNKLIDKGVEIDVLCSHPLYPNWRPFKTEEKLDGVNIFRWGSFFKYPKRPILRRLMLEIWYTFFVFFKSYRKKPDIIVSVIPPSLFIVPIINFLFKHKKNFIIVHDLQSIYADQKGIIGKLISKSVDKIEGMVFKSSYKVFFLSHSMYKEAHRKFAFLNNGNSKVYYPFSTISIQFVQNIKYKSLFENDKINLVYSGALGEKQNPVVLFQLFSKVASNSEFSVYVYSSGDFILSNKQSALKNDIKLYDLIPEDQLETLYYESDLQIIPQLFGTESGSIPSKLPNLYVCGVPIVAITSKNSELDIILRKDKYSLCLYSWDIDMLTNKIIEFGKSVKGIDKSVIRNLRISTDFWHQIRIDNLIDEFFI
jgi:colanic acid biosynthesis glycosyl transferase WcaI